MVVHRTWLGRMACGLDTVQQPQWAHSLAQNKLFSACVFLGKDVSLLSAEMCDFLKDKSPLGSGPPVCGKDRDRDESGVSHRARLNPEGRGPLRLRHVGSMCLVKVLLLLLFLAK